VGSHVLEKTREAKLAEGGQARMCFIGKREGSKSSEEDVSKRDRLGSKKTSQLG